MHILVAEDDAALGRFVRKGLEAEHYAVDVSADGEQARAMAGELDFDLVVLDLNLPRLDGVSILRFLRTRKPSMPILVLTGRTRVEDRVQGLDLGADDYLGNPFSFTELSARIRALIRRSPLPADSVFFWEHSLGCALVCRQFARKIGFSEPGKPYLAGLLHDIGIIAQLWVAPAEFRATMERASAEHIPLHEAEQAVLGINHTESGRIVAERWHFTPDLVQVVASHHDASKATTERALVALVSLSDLLCRMGGLGYGYTEDRQVNFLEEPGFAILEKECPKLDSFDWARFTFELEAYLDEVHQLVNLLYRGPK